MNHINFIQSKIYNKQSIQFWLNVVRLKNQKIVFTNGCFDLVHQGHIDYLSKAADLGDHLVVGLNSDESVKRLGKGNARPIQDEQSRALLIASLHFVSAVLIFNEDTPIELIQLIQPNVLVKGADWKLEQIVGYDFVKSKGGEIKTIEYLPGFSTTAIETKIKNS
jgi:rfaE bifunctional protein nucleotidyltransferase chain/domain